MTADTARGRHGISLNAPCGECPAANDGTARSALVEASVATLRILTDDERAEVFGHFCTACGNLDPRCTCVRDD